MKKQLEIFNDEINNLKAFPNVYGVLLIGSVAYGRATESSDLDIIVLCNKDKFDSKYVNGILVETHFYTYDTMLRKLIANPSEVYKYLYSKIIFDDGKLADIIQQANSIYNNYTTSESMKNEILYWLSSTKIKLTSALQENDLLKISYIISTNSWKVLEGIWAVNNKPMPPSSLAFLTQDTLSVIPYENWFTDLLIGDTISRGNSMLKIIEWICS